METNSDDRDYLDSIRDMVLVEDAVDEFAVIFHDQILARFADVIEACNYAEMRAKEFGAKWDLTVQARNAADMS